MEGLTGGKGGKRRGGGRGGGGGVDEPACGSGSTPKEQLTDQEEGEETRGNGRKGHRSVMRRLC